MLISKPVFDYYFLNEESITIKLGNEIKDATFILIKHLQTEIRRNPFPGFIDIVPAYSSLTIFFNLIELNESNLLGETIADKLTNYINPIFENISSSSKTLNREIIIPVLYGGEFGPDLKELAEIKQISEAEVIKLHTEAIYQVFMIGFVPGFAYMGGLNPLLTMSRKNTPRALIPAGSIGIAGNQTGIYPLESPGGWQIIGRTPLKMFDYNRNTPSLLQAGDQIKFQSISLDEYHHLYQLNYAD